MYDSKCSLFTVLFFAALVNLNAQEGYAFNLFHPVPGNNECNVMLSYTDSAPKSTDYSDCAAILYNGQMLVDRYSPSGKCKLEVGKGGSLSVSTVAFTEKSATPQKALKFHLAIKNQKTNTLFLLTIEPVSEIKLDDVLKQCKEGDSLVVLTVDKRYSLTHHEIEIIWGC